MYLCLAATKDKDNMQIHFNLTGQKENNVLFPCQKTLLRYKNLFACFSDRLSYEKYTQSVCTQVKCVASTKYLLQRDNTEQTLKLWLSVVIRSYQKTSRDMHCITFHKLDYETNEGRWGDGGVLMQSLKQILSHLPICIIAL